VVSDRHPCPESILDQFLADPQATLDASCIATLGPPDFTIAGAIATRWFCTADAWEGVAAPPP